MKAKALIESIKVGSTEFNELDIHSLTSHEDLNPKTLKEDASDLKHFIGWFG